MIRRLSQLWNTYANLGITPELSPLEARSTGLLNRISLIWLIVITLTLPLNWFLLGPTAVIVGVLNIIFSFGVLLLNRKHHYTAAKHYFILYLFALVLSGNLYAGPREMLHFLTLAILISLLFHQRKTIFRYMGFLALCFPLIAVYQYTHLHRFYLDPRQDMLGNALTTAVLVFGLFLPIFIFYRGLYLEYEKALKKREEELQTLVDTMNEGLVSLDPEGKITFINPAMKRMFGYPEAEILGHSPVKFLKETSRARFLQEFSQRRQGHKHSYEIDWLRKDGSTFHSLVAPQPLFEETGAFAGSVAVITDVSGLKEAELALARSEKHFRELVTYANSIIMRWDTDGKISFVNPFGLQFFGYTAEDLLGKNVSDTIVPETDSSGQDLKVLIQDIVHHPERHLYNENEVHDKQGRRYWVVWANRPLINEQGETTEILSIGQDITELKKAKETLGRQRDELRVLNHDLEAQKTELQAALERLRNTQAQLVDAEKMASLGQLTAGIAHELNNPINYIVSSAGPLRRDLEDISNLVKRVQELRQDRIQVQLQELEAYIAEIDLEFLNQEIASLLSGIEEGSLRTKEIVAGLRNFSRMDENEFKVADVHEGLDSTLTLLYNMTKRAVEIHKEYGPVGQLDCLPGKLNQVFMNLLVNAIQAFEENGREGKGNIWISTRTDDQNMYISIRDDGPGIPEEVKQRMFEPFFTTKPIGKGTGLGLAIVHGIIQQHHGSIEVESQVGKGTTFLLTLPLSQYEEETTASEVL